MDRRDFVKAALGTTAAATLAACSTPTAAPSSAGPVTLRCAWWGSDDRHAKTNAALKLFEAANPSVKVLGEGQAYDGYFDKLATQMAARDAPDVIQIAVELVKEYASKNAILPLTSVDLVGLDPSTTRQALLDGKQRAVASGLAVTNVVANKTMFARAGVPLPDDTTWTWDQFADIATRITKAGPDGVYGSGPLFQDWNLFAAYVRQTSPEANIFTDDGKLGFAEPAAESFMALLKRLMDAGATPPAAAAYEELAKPLEQSGSATNRFAMGFWPSSQYAAVVKASAQELVPLRLPSMDGTARDAKMGLGASQFWAVSATSKNPAQAQRLVDFFVNSPEAGQVMLVSRGSSPNAAVRAAVEPKLTAADAAISQFITAIQPETAPTPLPPPGTSQLQEVLRRHFSDFLFGRADASTAAQRLVAEARGMIRS